MKKASQRVDLSMLVKEDNDPEQIYSLIDKPYYVDRAKYKTE
jgi:hypothetical protein